MQHATYSRTYIGMQECSMGTQRILQDKQNHMSTEMCFM